MRLMVRKDSRRRYRQATAGSSAGAGEEFQDLKAPRGDHVQTVMWSSVLSPVRPERNAAPGCSSIRSGLRRPADHPGTGHRLRCGALGYWKKTEESIYNPRSREYGQTYAVHTVGGVRTGRLYAARGPGGRTRHRRVGQNYPRTAFRIPSWLIRATQLQRAIEIRKTAPFRKLKGSRNSLSGPHRRWHRGPHRRARGLPRSPGNAWRWPVLSGLR